jgi:membrane-associated phospholipid phosphatase
VTFLTDFADQAVVLPLALVVAGLLACFGRWRALAGWVVSTGGASAATFLLKLVFGACGAAFGLGIESPSGHTASATAVYGGLVVLLGAPPAAGIAAAVSIAATIGASRVTLGMHTVPEAVAGGAVGVVAVGALILLTRDARPALPRVALAATLLAVLLLFHGVHLHAEPAIRRLALLLAVWPFSACRGMIGP